MTVYVRTNYQYLEINMLCRRDRAFFPDFPDLRVEEGVRMLLPGGMSLPGHVRGRAADERVSG